MTEIVMPRLSDSMEEGTIVRWLKAEGDSVERGESIVEIETDKATMTYESDTAGVLHILVEEGRTLPIGEVIATVGEPGEAAPTAAADEAPPAPDTPAPSPAPGPAATPATERPAAAPAHDEDRILASPVARRIAREKGIDLAAVTGTGPGGRIVKADVEGETAGREVAAPAATAATGDGADSGRGTTTTTEPTRAQSLIARRMAESRATVPSFTLEASVDMTTATALRAEMKATALDGELVPTVNDLIVKACAIALREQPKANGAWRDGRFEEYSRVNVGVAVAGEGSLVVPTVFDADRLTLAEIAGLTRRLGERVRGGEITPPELSGGTFTVSNLGMFSVRSFEAIINQPQAGILAVGAIQERPAVHDGSIVPRMLMDLTLSCDHRILYGADGARLLGRIGALLEAPLSLAR